MKPLLRTFCGFITSAIHFILYPTCRLRAPEYLLIKDEMKKVLTKGKAAGVLRLVFHDAGTFDSGENSGIQGIFFSNLVLQIEILYYP